MVMVVVLVLLLLLQAPKCSLWRDRGDAAERCGEERVRQWVCCGLIITPVPHPLLCSVGERSQEWRSGVEPGKGGGRGAVRCFGFLPLNSITIGNKLIFTSSSQFCW